VAERVPVYPVAQAGAHVVPLDTGREQVPVTEFRMVGAEVHAAAVTQEPVVVHVPAAEQEAERVPVYPELHVGTHVVPEVDLATQFPGPELAIVGRPAHVTGAGVCWVHMVPPQKKAASSR
jgi:hypothetical protein